MAGVLFQLEVGSHLSYFTTWHMEEVQLTAAF